MSSNNSSSVQQGRKPSLSAYETTAALEQEHAATPQTAGMINTNASLEQSAAKEAANVAKGIGAKLTGNPEGDANAERVKEAMKPHTDMHIAQNYSSSQGTGTGTQTSNLSGKVSETASGVQSKVSETAGGMQSKAKETMGAASAKASEAAGTTSDETKGLYGTITNTASTAVQTAKDTATSALETAQEYLGMGTDAKTGEADTGLPPASSTGIPATSAPLESGKHQIGEPYPSSKKVAGGGVQVANVEQTKTRN